MIVETGRNDVIMRQNSDENVNYHEATSSEKSVKSQHESSTEFNDKNILEKENSNDQNYRR